MAAILVAVCLLISIILLVYILAQKNYYYWKKKNVPFAKPLPILGNYARYILLQDYAGQVVQKLCRQFPNKPYFGAFYGTEPVLIVQSPKLIKHILTKDFYFYNGREISKYETKEAITKSLFFVSGDRWKFLRQIMTPLFSSGKIKSMFYLIEKCSYDFEDALDSEINMSTVIEARDLSVRFTMDCIISCTFGIEANTLSEPENNPFRIIGTELFKATNYRGLKLVFRAIWPAIFYGLGFKFFPDSITKFFSQLLTGVMKSRNYKPSSRNDFVDLVLTLKKSDVIDTDSIKNALAGHNEQMQFRVNDEILVGQCIGLFGASYDTTATTLSFTLFEFAKNQEVQKRAVEEVDEFLRRYDNKLKYECVNELPYVTACLHETLRKYPVAGNLTREVMEDTTLPDGLHLEKGIRIHIPVYKLNHDPDYFPEPDSYKPERFLPENSINIKKYTFLPYGEGPRICIGQRFSKTQILPGLITFLKSYWVELDEGMPETVTFESRTFLIQPREQGLMLKVTKRDGWEQRLFVRS